MNAVISMLRIESDRCKIKNARKIWKDFYSNKNMLTRYRCGNHCLFIDEEGDPVEFSFFDGMMMKYRIARFLSGIKFKCPRDKAMTKSLNKIFTKYAHEACQPERLSENDYFNISMILE